MIKKLMCVSMAVVVWAAVAAKEGHPQAELVASVEFAPFSDVKAKIVDFGKTINQPMVSVMAVPALQNFLTENLGEFRADSPMKLLCYADVAALRKALETESQDCVADALEPAFIYPCADGVAKFIENHPEAKKKANNLIELEDGNVVLFAQDERTCVLASKVAVAKRALASLKAKAAKAKPKKFPLVRVNVTKGGLALFADFHKKMLDTQQAALKGGKGVKPCQDALLASLTEFQRMMGLRQNAILRDLVHFSISFDYDKTGFVVRGSLKAKPGATVSPFAGFTLPAGAFADVPAGAPIFGAANPLSWDIRSEADYREMLGSVAKLVNGFFSCIKEAAPAHAQTVDGINAAFADVFASAPYPAPTDWYMFALAFGPQQEPYMVCAGEGAKVSEGQAAANRFNATLVDVIGKKWPGIVSVNGTALFVDWAKLIDVVAVETKGSPESVDQAKKIVAKILGGTVSEFSTVTPSPTSFRTYIGTKGFTPPPASSGEPRLAAALPEIVAKRPSGAYYLSLYSFVRDTMMPIALKVAPAKRVKDIQSIMAVLPKAADNGAIAGACWDRKDGSSSFLLRVTKGEIQSIGAAANAIISAQAQSATQPEK